MTNSPSCHACGAPNWLADLYGREAQPSTAAREQELEHAKDEKGRCRPWCYACERKGLQERIRFTEDYETLQSRLAATDAPREKQGWQPIRTAPKDGTRVLLLWRNGHVTDGYWDRVDGWPPNSGLTHWMPFPDAPRDAQEDQS